MGGEDKGDELEEELELEEEAIGKRCFLSVRRARIE
jgi:hypothetical protein